MIFKNEKKSTLAVKGEDQHHLHMIQEEIKKIENQREEPQGLVQNQDQGRDLQIRDIINNQSNLHLSNQSYTINIMLKNLLEWSKKMNMAI
jgi:hypothetical protein